MDIRHIINSGTYCRLYSNKGHGIYGFETTDCDKRNYGHKANCDNRNYGLKVKAIRHRLKRRKI